ncbi:tripartite tricarboxylate transporter substrate binding protein [Alcaligenaceae bacterium]|nr:tripartite tricarboxylate transporter substrate binding protein [Alcaligenaceae bacterium]
MISKFHHAVFMGAALCAITLPVHAEKADATLSGPLTIVVGYAPGGAADTAARAYAEQLRKDGAGTIIVENRAGASGRIGLNYVKDAKPDGKTMYLVPSPLLTIFPLTYKNPGYDAEKDLRAVAMLVDIPTAIVTGASQPFDGMQDYVKWAKSNPAAVTSLGVATLGSSGHLGILAVNEHQDMKIEPVAYRGASPMLIDVSSGVVSIGWDAVASMMPLYQAKKIKFLGVSGEKRLDALPEVKTLAEQGFPEFKAATSFYGIVVPAKTPDSAVAALEAAFLKASEAPELRDQLAAKGLITAPAKGADMAQRTREELASWRPVVERTGIVMD